MVDPLDDRDPYEGTGKTAMDQAQARGDRSYSSIGSAVNVSGDGDSGPSTQANLLALRQMKKQERPSFIERVSGKLSSIYGGREVDPTGFYRSIPSKVKKTSEKLMDKAIPGRDSQFGFVPSLIGGKVGAALSLLDYVTNQDKPFENFLDKLGVDKKEQLQLVPTPTVAQFRQGERDALDPRNLAPIQPSARINRTSRGDPLDIPVEEANPAGLSQLQRSRGGLPVEGRGGGLGDFVAIASPASRPEFLVGTRAPNIALGPPTQEEPFFALTNFQDPDMDALASYRGPQATTPVGPDMDATASYRGSRATPVEEGMTFLNDLYGPRTPEDLRAMGIEPSLEDLMGMGLNPAQIMREGMRSSRPRSSGGITDLDFRI